MDPLRYLIRGLSPLLLVGAIALPARAAPPAGPSSGPEGAVRPADRSSPSYYVILNSPSDLDALLQKIRQPDLEVRRVDRLAPPGVEGGPAGGHPAPPPGVVESVQVRGRLAEDFAALTVEMAIVTASDDPIWVPIHLDGEKLAGAREGTRELVLRMADRGRWQVELAGRGRHHIAVQLRAPITAKPARKALALAIPEAPSTALELDFPRHESDIIIGSNEDYGQTELPGGTGTRLTAHLSPRPRIEVSWTDDADSGGPNPPLLTAQGEIAVDIDAEQMRTRSSWAIRCVRGMTRNLEIRVDDQDEVTELRLDDQPTEAGIEGARGAGRLTIRLGEPLRPGDLRRLVLKTRRAPAPAAGRRLTFAGFPLSHAREQSGFIGITQGPNLWISATTSPGLRQIEPGRLPFELRTRPATSLAFEFLDQPFRLHLDVEPSPPLVRAQSRSLLRLDPDRARSETTIELQRVRGQLFEVGLGLGPGLQLASVGPREVIESFSLTTEAPRRGPADPERATRRLRVRLTPAARDQNPVTLRLEGQQRLPRAGAVELGLFTPEEATSVHASFTLVADRSLALELDDDAGRVTRPGGLPAPGRGPSWDQAAALPRGELGAPPLELASSDNPRSLPIRIARHARGLAQETLLAARVSRGAVDWLQRTTFRMHHGALGSLEVRVPAPLADRWELLDRGIIHREELGRDRDGATRYRLYFDRPVLDRATLRFRARLPLAPQLDASAPRDVALPGISFPEVPARSTRVELAPGPEVLFRGVGPGWIRAPDEAQMERAGEAPVLAFTEDPGRRGCPFVFTTLALESVALPPLVVPRLLIRTVQGFDETIRSRAWYWVEAHGPVFAFAMPAGARWLAARVDGRLAEQVDRDPARPGYRLRLPADVGSRPVLIELDYQVSGPGAGGHWPAPQLLDGGVVLETLWDVRLPAELTLVGVPRGWSDENEWYWDGNLWKRRPWKNGAALAEWLLGTTAAPTAMNDPEETGLDEAHRFLFSRTGPPADLDVWVVSRAWAVATCSGAALLVGFVMIFARIRFRTAWAVVAGLVLLAAALAQPSATLLGVQSALIGVALTLLGLLIQRLLDRVRPPVSPGREPGTIAPQTITDSSLNRPASVGSDDSTAIRVRAPSTMDFVPSPAAGPPIEDETRGVALGGD